MSRRKRPLADAALGLFGFASVSIKAPQQQCESFDNCPVEVPTMKNPLRLSDAQLYRMALDLSNPPSSLSADVPSPPVEDNILEETLEYPEIVVMAKIDDYDDFGFQSDMDDNNDGSDGDSAIEMEDRYYSASRRAGESRLEHKNKSKHERINIERCISVRSVKKELAKVDLELSDRYLIEAPRSYDLPTTPVRIRPFLEQRVVRDNTPAPVIYSGAYYTGTPVPRASTKPAHAKKSAEPTPAEREAERRYEQDLRLAVTASTTDKHASGLTIQQLLDLSNRDLTPEDYDMLLMLDATVEKKTLKQAEIAKLDERVLSAVDSCVTSKEDCCSVCLVNYSEGERVKVLPCSHLFHCECIVPWLQAHSQSCPLCNVKLA
jgi:hypothetical protein